MPLLNTTWSLLFKCLPFQRSFSLKQGKSYTVRRVSAKRRHKTSREFFFFCSKFCELSSEFWFGSGFVSADELSKIMAFFYYGAAKPPCLNDIENYQEAIPSVSIDA